MHSILNTEPGNNAKSEKITVKNIGSPAGSSPDLPFKYLLNDGISGPSDENKALLSTAPYTEPVRNIL